MSVKLGSTNISIVKQPASISNFPRRVWLAVFFIVLLSLLFQEHYVILRGFLDLLELGIPELQLAGGSGAPGRRVACGACGSRATRVPCSHSNRRVPGGSAARGILCGRGGRGVSRAHSTRCARSVLSGPRSVGSSWTAGVLSVSRRHIVLCASFSNVLIWLRISERKRDYWDRGARHRMISSKK